MNLEVYDGVLHSPYFVFIRDWNYGESEMLSRLGISQDYKESSKLNWRDHYFCMLQRDSWTVIADSWYYDLWHSLEFLDSIRKIARDHELLLLMVGDSDNSFEIEYHKEGVLKRQFIFDQVETAGTQLCDYGEPFEAESKIHLGGDPLKVLFSLPDELNIPWKVSGSEEFRFFTKRYRKEDRKAGVTWKSRLLGTQGGRS